MGKISANHQIFEKNKIKYLEVFKKDIQLYLF